MQWGERRLGDFVTARRERRPVAGSGYLWGNNYFRIPACCTGVCKFSITHCLAFTRWWFRRLEPAAIPSLPRLRLRRPLHSVIRGTLLPRITFESGCGRTYRLALHYTDFVLSSWLSDR